MTQGILIVPPLEKHGVGEPCGGLPRHLNRSETHRWDRKRLRSDSETPQNRLLVLHRTSPLLHLHKPLRLPRTLSLWLGYLHVATRLMPISWPNC